MLMNAGKPQAADEYILCPLQRQHWHAAPQAGLYTGGSKSRFNSSRPTNFSSSSIQALVMVVAFISPVQTVVV
ncbi:MAG: hypothetical protein A1D16_14070 [Flavihumibacter sp. CACIAM 22H1]|nr:MAG: hypothetical protein A1D16_14070 [Flavihumibacter sp. CACIAM 22H1]